MSVVFLRATRPHKSKISFRQNRNARVWLGSSTIGVFFFVHSFYTARRYFVKMYTSCVHRSERGGALCTRFTDDKELPRRPISSIYSVSKKSQPSSTSPPLPLTDDLCVSVPHRNGPSSYYCLRKTVGAYPPHTCSRAVRAVAISFGFLLSSSSKR